MLVHNIGFVIEGLPGIASKVRPETRGHHDTSIFPAFVKSLSAPAFEEMSGLPRTMDEVSRIPRHILGNIRWPSRPEKRIFPPPPICHKPLRKIIKLTFPPIPKYQLLQLNHG